MPHHRTLTGSPYQRYARIHRGHRKGQQLTQLASQSDDKHFEVRLSDESFETYELDPPSYTLDVTKKELKQMYYDMVAVR